MILIESIDRERGVCTVHFSDGAVRRVPRAALRAAKIHNKTPLDPAAFDAILSKYMTSAAYTRCAALLSMKGQTEHQLRESLARVSYPQEVIEKVISSLLSAGYLNDKAFAEQWISRRTATGIGKSRIRTELRLKGISAELIESAFAAFAEEETAAEETEEGLKRAFEKASRNRDIGDPRDRQKVIAALVRKGYSFSDAYRAIKEYS